MIKLTPPAPHVPSNKYSTFYVFSVHKDNMDYTCLGGVVYILVSHGYNKTWDLIQEFLKKMTMRLDVPLHHFLILKFHVGELSRPVLFRVQSKLNGT